jgi:hypothetical protein
MPVILWLLGVPFVVVVLLMLTHICNLRYRNSVGAIFACARHKAGHVFFEAIHRARSHFDGSPAAV